MTTWESGADFSFFLHMIITSAFIFSLFFFCILFTFIDDLRKMLIVHDLQYSCILLWTIVVIRIIMEESMEMQEQQRRKSIWFFSYDKIRFGYFKCLPSGTGDQSDDFSLFSSRDNVKQCRFNVLCRLVHVFFIRTNYTSHSFY